MEITLTLTNDQWVMIKWEAARRGVSEDILIGIVMNEVLVPLSSRFAQSTTNKIIALIEKMPATKQVELLQVAEASLAPVVEGEQALPVNPENR